MEPTGAWLYSWWKVALLSSGNPATAPWCHRLIQSIVLGGHRKGVSPCPLTCRAAMSVRQETFRPVPPFPFTFRNSRVDPTKSLWAHARAVNQGSGFRAACRTKTNKVSLSRACQQHSHTIATIVITELLGLPSKAITRGGEEEGKRWIQPPDPHRKNNKVCKRKFWLRCGLQLLKHLSPLFLMWREN